MRYVLAALLAIGCATARSNYDGDPETQALVDCAATTECFVIHIDNEVWAGATFYLNGGRFAWVEGKSKATLPIPRSRLDGGLCAQFRIYFIAGGSFYTSKECVRPGGHYTLLIDGQGHLWLTPWGGKA